MNQQFAANGYLRFIIAGCRFSLTKDRPINQPNVCSFFSFILAIGFLKKYFGVPSQFDLNVFTYICFYPVLSNANLMFTACQHCGHFEMLFSAGIRTHNFAPRCNAKSFYSIVYSK
jgi:hypothetical protein